MTDACFLVYTENFYVLIKIWSACVLALAGPPLHACKTFRLQKGADLHCIVLHSMIFMQLYLC